MDKKRVVIALGGNALGKDIEEQKQAVAKLSLIHISMQYIKCDVSTICLGLAASFGAFLLAGGAHGKRMALPNSEIMIHQPAMHGNGIQGPASDIKIMSDYMQKSRQRLNRVLAVNTGRSEEEIARDTERDNFMSAEEALEYGLIDSILTRR